MLWLAYEQNFSSCQEQLNSMIELWSTPRPIQPSTRDSGSWMVIMDYGVKQDGLLRNAH